MCFDAEMLWSYHHHRFKCSSHTRIQPLFHPYLLRIIATAAYALPPPPPPLPNFKARLTPCVTYILGVCLTLAWRGVTAVGTASTVTVVSTRRYRVTTILIRSIATVYLHRYNICTVFLTRGKLCCFSRLLHIIYHSQCTREKSIDFVVLCAPPRVSRGFVVVGRRGKR